MMTHWTQFTMPALAVMRRRVGRPSQNKKVSYARAVFALDTETSRISGTNDAALYLWQFALAIVDDDMNIKWCKTCYGRYVEELPAFFKLVLKKCPDESTLCGYVHNLSYDFAFISPFLQDLETFCLDRRKVLKCTAFDGKIELRDSYRQTNRKLETFARDMKAEHGKLDGNVFDYNEVRYPWTELTPYQMEYGENDVLALVESICIEMQKFGDNLYTIPMTSTGYLRRDAKAAITNQAGMLTAIREILPDKEQFEMLREIFRGGNTHANRRYAGLIVSDVYSNDLSSSYPSWMIYCKYPITKFKKVREPNLRHVKNIIDTGCAVIMRIAMYDVELRRGDWGFPYLAKDKCRKIPMKSDENNVYDNGRILKCQYLETSCTDIDLKIILEEYTGAIEVQEAYFAKYGELPHPYTDLIKQLYTDKTRLKNVAGDDAEFHYLLAKMKINAGYGMMAQNPCKFECEFFNESGNYEYDNHDGVIDELLAEYHEKGWLPYQWGCWVTAWARYALEQGLKIAYDETTKIYGHDTTLYCDTDSVKYAAPDYINFGKWNDEILKKSEELNANAVDPHGEKHYMGIFEHDGHYKRFSTLGAKKYAYEDDKGKLHITIAGVSKKTGAEELGTLENFRLADNIGQPFIFRKAGGVEAVYNDTSDYWIDKDGHKLHITRNILLRPSTYTLGATAEYTAFVDLNQTEREKIAKYLCVK